MGCHLSKKLDEVVTDADQPPDYTTSPQLQTGNLLNEKRQSKNSSQTAPRPGSVKAKFKESVRRSNHQRGSKSNLSPIYNRLPKKAKQCYVKSVYDGDTLTLRNNKRVRFLGMDTPELKNPTQAFSQEAKAYTVQRCDVGQPIWISYEEGHPTEDRYGRLLCWIWVATSNGKYECVNEGLVKEGLATVYTPSKSAKLYNVDKLIAMQKEARLAKKGLWQNFQDYKALKAPRGIAFHHTNRQCEHIQKSKTLTLVFASIAMDEGRHACRTCLADG